MNHIYFIKKGEVEINKKIDILQHRKDSLDQFKETDETHKNMTWAKN